MTSSESPIQVSVCIVTYNHEKYIAECLDSLVNQQTNFKFEIIIGEDCSTDSTRAIVQQYLERYPELIVPVFHSQNVGAVENTIQVYKKAKGKYIAHIDGDDMALPSKLQKQFDILEANPDCAICGHDMKAIDAYSKPMAKAFNSFEERKYTLLDMYLINPFFIHSSKMFVNKIEDYVDQLNATTLDTQIHIYQAMQGDIYFLNETLGIYRQFVGITYEAQFVRSFVRNGIISIYENVDASRFSKHEIEKIKEKYATILINFAYQSAVSVKDKELFKEYVNRSWELKKTGKLSYAFKISSLHPELFFVLFNLRKRIHKRLKLKK